VLTYVIPETEQKASKQHKNGTTAHTGQCAKILLQCYEIKTYTYTEFIANILYIIRRNSK